MPSAFSSYDLAEAGNVIADARVDIVIGQNGRLVADIASAEIGDLRLLRLVSGCGSLCTYGLDPERLVVAFPTRAATRQVWQGAVLRMGEFIVLGPGGRFYQVMKGPGAWAWLTISTTTLTYWCRVISGNTRKPVSGAVLRPQRSAFERLARIHHEALAVVAQSPQVLTGPEASRALEQELIHALVNCLTAPGTIAESDSAARLRRRHSGLMLDFDGYLDTFPEQSLSIAEIGEELDVSERTLRLVCKRFAGIGPRAYSFVRRMNAARGTLLEADPNAESVSSVARTFGFQDAGRFAMRYRQLFGENPLATLRGDGSKVTLRQSMAESE